MREILVVITRMSNELEWNRGDDEGWGFPEEKEMAFIEGSCNYWYEFPNEKELKDLRLIVIRGDGERDIVSTILDLFKQMQNDELWFLFHPGGSDTFRDGVTENKLQQRIKSGREEKWKQFQEKVTRVCAYSLGRGGKASATVKDLFTAFREKKKEEFQHSVTILIKGINNTINLKCYDDLNDFEKQIEVLKGGEKEPLITPLGKATSRLKHRVSHLFSPIDMDLQGLWDEAVNSERNNFNIDQWNDVVKAYRSVNWKQRFTEVEDLEMDGQKIQHLMEKEMKDLKIESLHLLELLSDKTAHEKVYRLLANKEGASALHEWLEKLDKSLDSRAAEKGLCK